MLAEEIKSNVVSQLSWDSRVDATDVNVDVDGSTVILEGTVPTSIAKFAAVDDALNIVGVTEVINNIDVKLIDDQITDQEIENRINNTLTYNSSINSFNLDVSVKNNWVTLEGTVDEIWKKILIEEEIQDVTGVVGVTSKIVIANDLNITDKVLAQEIIDAIDRDARVQADKINVEVNDGEVTLSGTVHQYSAKGAAWNAAIRTAGVTKVNNLLIVEDL